MRNLVIMSMLIGLLSGLAAAPIQHFTVDDWEVAAIQDAPQSIATEIFGEDAAVQTTLKKLYPREAAPARPAPRPRCGP